MNTYKRDSYDRGLFRRGRFYWYAFRFKGAQIYESTRATSKTIARAVMEQRKAELTLGLAGISKKRAAPLFSLAAKNWFESKTALTPLGRAYYRQYIGKLNREFGSRLISDISASLVICVSIAFKCFARSLSLGERSF